MCRAMATSAADSLLADFGYSLYANEGVPPGTYLGRVAPRNSWHDCIASFALIASGVLGVGGESAPGLVRQLTLSYRGETGAIYHEPVELRSVADKPPVAFTGTQALWSAVVRAAEIGNAKSEAAGGVDLPALRTWCESFRQPASGLLPVANEYPDARLWANTEWAAWVLLDRSVFTGEGEAE